MTSQSHSDITVNIISLSLTTLSRSFFSLSLLLPGACDNNIKIVVLANILCVRIVVVCGEKVFMAFGWQTGPSAS